MASGASPEATAAVKKFQALREQQQQCAQMMGQKDQEKHEFTVVINTLEKTSPDRTCYRMEGCVLVKRKVGEVLPMLQAAVKKIDGETELLKEDLVAKGDEINALTKKYNLRMVSGQEMSEMQRQKATSAAPKAVEGKGKGPKASPGVLVE